MKYSIFLVFIVGFFLTTSVHAQINRCVTQEKMQEIFQKNPQTKIRFENTKKILDDKVRLFMADPQAALNKTTTIINIPVAVHILLDDPSVVTDMVVQRQIDTLNFYYGNAPANDSLRIYAPFRASYGRSQIRFCLAQRTPLGIATNGIERLASSETFTTITAHPSTFVSAWNTQKYLNIWVIDFTDGTLGYSYLPGTFAPGDEQAGLVVDYRAFGSGPAYLYPEYNLGRTAVHEIGHFFDLLHPWGNGSSNPGCSQDDGIADTPPSSGPFFGCPGIVPVINACSPAAPGMMWQNHMDYSDDACMNLFTMQQVVRMETALNTAPDRNTLITSNGCQVVVLVPDDAGISTIVTPENGGVFCAPAITPVVTLRNYGTNSISSVSINLTVNGVTSAGYPYVWNGNLSPGTFTSVTLPSINLTPGSNNIVVFTSQPNGVADGSTSNDGTTVTVSMPTPSGIPFFEGFESATFPPLGWTRINPDGGISWQRFTSGTAATGTAMTRINYFNYGSLNQKDELITAPIDANAVAGNKVLNFARAYRQYGTAPGDMDTLEILASPDCGTTYTSIWKKWGAALATVSDTSPSSFVPASINDWLTETLDVSAFASPGMRIKFRGINRFGNNLYIDNVSVQKQSDRDLKITSIDAPAATSCTSQIAPKFTVMNMGLETITSFQLGYRIGTSPFIFQTFTLTLNTGDMATLTLTPFAANLGNQTITALTANPVSATGVGDVQKNNDTLRKNFTVVSLYNPPLVEGFEKSFPPAGWNVLNPNGNVTWMKKSPGRNTANAAFMNNFNTNLVDQTDDLKTPFLNVSGADSLIMSFDVAHKNYPSAFNSDTLEILISTNCGNTYASVYKKWGNNLSTAGTSLSDFTNPVNSDWRNERLVLDKTFTANGSINLLIRNINRSGNNIFLDNVNITSKFKRDIQINSINQPNAVLCSTNVTPSVTVKNTGMETITNFKVTYRIDNNVAQTTSVSGIILPSNAETTINMITATILGAGVHTIKIYSWEPVSPNGTGDLYTFNDTLSKTFSIAGTIDAPFLESFETAFPPSNWSVINPDGGISWNGYPYGFGNPGSAFVNTFNYTESGQKDDLVSPLVNFKGVDSVKLTFDLSAVTYNNPVTTGMEQDTLEVLVSKDCGTTFNTIYKKWGNTLQTVKDFNSPQTISFFPMFDKQWRKETVDLTAFGSQGPLLLFFRTTNNHENNIFIDNVNLTTRVLPTLIKQQGYLVLPSPFKNSFGVWHLQLPTTLRYIQVYNSLGQLVWSKQFIANAGKVEMVDLSAKAGGVYVVKLGYEDAKKNEVVKIVKTN